MGKKRMSNVAETVVVAVRVTRANATISSPNAATRAASIVEVLDFRVLVAAVPVVDDALDFIRFPGNCYDLPVD